MQKTKKNSDSSKSPNQRSSFKDFLKNIFVPKSRRARRALLVLLAVFLVPILSSYGIAQWYIFKHKSEPLSIGATFVADYSRRFGIDPEETLYATIHDLGVKKLRLVSYWKVHEQTEGTYDFSELDWQFKMAEEAGVKVSLAIGLRQPRWPECHEPDWAKNQPIEFWYPKLKDYMARVIERYGDNPMLESYQLENEFFMEVFGICPDHSRWRLEEEYDLVKRLDPNTPVIVSRSNNWIGLPLGNPRPDRFAISVYKRVWDKTLTKRYFEYPLPAWFYAALAGGAELMTGRDMIIHELQAEAWLPEGIDMETASIEELYKSMNPTRLKNRIRYGVATGMRDIYLWGPEWWYFMKEKRGAPELWETAKTEIAKYNN